MNTDYNRALPPRSTQASAPILRSLSRSSKRCSSTNYSQPSFATNTKASGSTSSGTDKLRQRAEDIVGSFNVYERSTGTLSSDVRREMNSLSANMRDVRREMKSLTWRMEDLRLDLRAEMRDLQKEATQERRREADIKSIQKLGIFLIVVLYAYPVY
jgi:hypothetical protein